MAVLRHLIICALLIAVAVPSAFAQSTTAGSPQPPVAPRLTINYAWPPQPPAVAAALHPAAKGAVIGAVAGAGAFGALGLWYCTIGPNEVGECRNSGMWTRGLLLWGGRGRRRWCADRRPAVTFPFLRGWQPAPVVTGSMPWSAPA